MPSHSEFYDAIKNISVNADTLNLNTDQVESKLDTTTGLLTTLSADTAIIKNDLANGVLSDVRDGTGNALTSATRGSQRALSVQIVDGSGNQVTSFGSSSVSVSNFPATQPVSGTFWQATQPVSGTVTANAGTGTFNISDKGSTGESTVTAFTSTSSAVLKASNSNRKLLTIFNEGNGTLFILLGSGTAATSNYSLRLLGGDYYELEKYTGELNAIFTSTGTARVTEIT